MRLVRDVGRYLARKRLANSPHGLIPLLLGRDEPVFEVDVDDQENAMTFTPDELAGYRGDGDSPIYLSILGRIYDVSSGKAFYGMLFLDPTISPA